LIEVRLRRIDAREALESVIQQFGITVSFAVDLELVKMAIDPTHRRLRVLVKFFENAVNTLILCQIDDLTPSSVILNW
jgi:hypothetical protein